MRDGLVARLGAPTLCGPTRIAAPAGKLWNKKSGPGRQENLTTGANFTLGTQQRRSGCASPDDEALSTAPPSATTTCWRSDH